MAHTEQEDEEMFNLSLMIGSVCSGRNPMIVSGALITVLNDLIDGLDDQHMKLAFANGAIAGCNSIKKRLTT